MKKGQQELLFLVFQLLLIAIVFLSLLAFVKQYEDNTIFEKIYLSRDISLIISTIEAAPGNLFYNYSHTTSNLSRFEYSFNDQLLSITEEGKARASYPYLEDETLGILNEQISQESIPFTKTISMTLEKNSLLIRTYPLVNTKDPEWRNKDQVLKLPALEIQESALQSARDQFDNQRKINNLKESSPSPDIYIEIIFDDQNKKRLSAIIPHNKKSRKLASIILNKFAKEGITGAISLTNKNEQLNKANAAVLLIVGTDVSKNAHLLAKAVEDYYG